MVEPFLIPFFSERDGQQPRTHAIDEPVPTVTGHGAVGVVEPFLVPQFSEHNARSVERPLNTVTTTSRGIGLVEPFLVAAGGPEGKGAQSQER